MTIRQTALVHKIKTKSQEMEPIRGLAAILKTRGESDLAKGWRAESVLKIIRIAKEEAE